MFEQTFKNIDDFNEINALDEECVKILDSIGGLI